MAYLAALVIDGALAGVVYALVALAFVVVYKASRIVNFALGEWTMVATAFVATGVHALGWGLAPALAGAAGMMVLLGIVFNRTVLRALTGRPLIALIMVTLGLGAFLRGLVPIVFRDVPRRLPWPISDEPLMAYGLAIAPDRVAAATVAVAAVAGVSWFFRASRTGVALRAIADDQQVAMAMGIDLSRYFSLTWAVVGLVSVLGGTLWSVVGAGGFGVVLLGLKVFPIVIIGGLDSIPGTVVGAILIGVLESVAVGYLDPWMGGGFSNVASYLVLIGVLLVRPFGLFGRADVARV